MTGRFNQGLIVVAGLAGLVAGLGGVVLGQPPGGPPPSGPGPGMGTPPVYQRHAFEWSSHDRDRNDDRHPRHHDQRWVAPQTSAGWFQRPYPYHLDYYKMRYGGSYAPYFGNLYGTPQVVTAPPYGYGPWAFDGGYPAYGNYPPYGTYPQPIPPVAPNAPNAPAAPWPSYYGYPYGYPMTDPAATPLPPPEKNTTPKTESSTSSNPSPTTSEASETTANGTPPTPPQPKP